MKVIVNDKSGADERPFPKLMSWDGMIVLFDKPNHGTIVGSHCNHNIGWFMDDWRMYQFTDFHGEITLSND